MATRKSTPRSTKPRDASQATLGTFDVDQLLLERMQQGDGSHETGRMLVTFKPGALDDGMKAMKRAGLRTASARDFDEQAVAFDKLGDADTVMFPEIGVALMTGTAAAERGMSAQAEPAADSAIESIEPEYFVFSDGMPDDYLRGFLRAAETIARDLGEGRTTDEPGADVLVQGATWGLAACRVPPSTRSGAGMRVAVLDTGMDLLHPDFAGRTIVSRTFVSQPVQDLHSHGTHCIGTSCGPRAPAGTTPRYGIAYGAQIHVGKVLSNSGSSVGGSVLAGMNWAIANRCTVISMSLGSQSPVSAAYTAAGNAALDAGCLIVAAAGNSASSTGAPANSPSIMSVASLDTNLAPSSFSNFGKIEIAAPGRDVFSSVPRPTRYGFKSGTSMATPHVAGCAALWAQTSATLRGRALWTRVLSAARALPYSATRVGRGLVQAP